MAIEEAPRLLTADELARMRAAVGQWANTETLSGEWARWFCGHLLSHIAAQEARIAAIGRDKEEQARCIASMDEDLAELARFHGPPQPWRPGQLRDLVKQHEATIAAQEARIAALEAAANDPRMAAQSSSRVARIVGQQAKRYMPLLGGGEALDGPGDGGDDADAAYGG